MLNCTEPEAAAQHKGSILTCSGLCLLLICIAGCISLSSWHSSILSVTGLKARGVRTDAHVSVNSVVEHMLAAEAEEAALSGEPLPSPETATSPHLPAASKQKQGDQLTLT